jgi:hypothetical protein
MISMDVGPLILSMRKLVQKANPVKRIKRRNPTVLRNTLLNIRRIHLWNTCLNMIISGQLCTKKIAFVICERVPTVEKLSEHNKYRQTFIQKLNLSSCPRTLRERKPHKSSKSVKSPCIKSKCAHQRTHMGERHNECTKFGKSFNKSQTLYNIRERTQEKNLMRLMKVRKA